MKRLLALAALALAVTAAWLLWPRAAPPAGPSIGERVKSSRAPAGALSAKVIPDEDLPPAGTRSLFDHVLAQNDGIRFPFEKLVATIQSYDGSGRAPVAVMIPSGRSLLKAQASFARPRIAYAADFQAPDTDAELGLAARGELFVAYVEQANELEVISYNEAAGRFEFQLVQDYREGGVPRIVYARRAVCTACHQGAAPIFPQRPWSETNGQPAVASRLRAAMSAEHYFGLPAGVPLAAPERLDELTDVANFLPVAQRAWLDGCGEGAPGAACRRQMLKVALLYASNPGSFDPGGAEAAALRRLQAASWPQDGIAVPEPDLHNRDPLAESATWRARLAALLQPSSSRDGARSNEDLESFDRLPKLPVDLDPLTPRAPRRVLRASDLDGAFGLAQFLTADDARLLERATAGETARLAQAVARIPESEFGAAPFSRSRAVNAVLAALKQKPRSYAFLDTTQMSPPQALGVPPLAIGAESPLRPFEQYCFACHRGNPSARLDFMSGRDEAEVLEHLKRKAEVRDVLDWTRYGGTDRGSKLMPPADSRQRALLSAALQQDPALLEKMRKVVPAMFDF
ncbi:MAG TPA: hypothetical protein VM369_10600 [Candidatus Binatia bacterium]|nr:hypothetical protein [Candidatus Binatia bacterium]